MNNRSNQNGGLNRPIRVVVFGSGPLLELDFRQFIARLEGHGEIELLGVFCQSRGQSIGALAGDLWRRRRLLAGPLLALHFIRTARHWVCSPLAAYRLRRAISRLGNQLHFVPDIHAPPVLSRIGELSPDLGLVYGSPILKPILFEIPALGTLGIHHGQAPRYRGKKTTFWEIYNGEPTAGVTIQKITSGLDVGGIVNSGTVPIGRRGYGAVFRETLALGLDLYIEAILRVRAGTAVEAPQAGEIGRLFRDPTPKDILRFWLRRFRRIFHLQARLYDEL